MKQLLLSLLAALSLVTAAQEYKYYDAREYPLLGKAIDNSASNLYFMRLPDSIAPTLERPGLMHMAQCAAGMAVRFASDSPAIGAKWKSPANRTMNHQSPCGTRGIDLYVLADDGKTWQYVNAGQPSIGSPYNAATFISGLEPRMREYMIFTSLYDGVDSLYIGVDPAYTVAQPAVNLPQREKPIIIYGSSILQGGCCTRAGMAHTNMLMRKLNRQVINLGFSGLGQLDLQVARVIAAVKDPGMIVMDMVPNASVGQMDTLLVRFYNIIRESHPTVPILFVEDPNYTHARFDTLMRKEIDDKNVCIRKHFRELIARGEKNIYFLDNKDFIGHDFDATIDGVHFTDLGFERYTAVLLPIIRKRARK